MNKSKKINQYKQVLFINLDNSSRNLPQKIRLNFITREIYSSKPKKILNELKFNLPDGIVICIASLNKRICSLIHSLKQNEKYQLIPLMLISMTGLTGDQIQCYNSGCDLYISRPSGPEEITCAIESMIRRKSNLVQMMYQIYKNLKQIKVDITEKYRYTSPNLCLFLTKQEALILKGLLNGRTCKEISLMLNISLRNTEKYITRLLDKTQVKNSRELLSLPWDIILVIDKANNGNRTRE